MDVFQDRYLEHQDRKKKALEENIGEEGKHYGLVEKTSLLTIMKNRRSQRLFNSGRIEDEDLNLILTAANEAPSSCNRQAIYLTETYPETAEHYLVGGKGWMDKAEKVLLVFADKEAYKSPNEKGFMPYLDAGFVGQNIYLMCEVLGLGCCFVNPNIREENKEKFVETFGDDYFCGAVALGKTKIKSKRPPKRETSDILR